MLGVAHSRNPVRSHSLARCRAPYPDWRTTHFLGAGFGHGARTLPRRPRMNAHLRRLLVTAVCATTLLGGNLSAQLRGTVRTPDGESVPSALVELWSYARRIAGTGTDSLGRFRMASPQDTIALVLLVRRMGFRPFRAQLRPSDSVVNVVLQPRPIELPGPTVTRPQEECTQRDDPRARALYRAAAERYDTELSATGVRATSMVFRAVVPPESVGVIDTARLRFQFIAGGARNRFRDPQEYYARPVSGILWPRFDQWEYPFLESIEAWHFADTSFASRNHLTLASLGDALPALRFCSRNGRRPYIEGVLYLGADSSFARASWRFVVPRSAEQAGGQVVFARVPRGVTGAPLLPIAGLFWRRQVSSVYTEWMEFREWGRCPSPGNCGRALPFR